MMPTAFPGMDPYLERRGLWEEVHTRLIVAMADELTPLVLPRDTVAVEQRTYLALVAPDDFAGKPDVMVLQAAGVPANLNPIPTLTGVMPLVAELPMPEEITERFLEVRDLATDEVITTIELFSPTNKNSREGRDAYNKKRMKVLGSQSHFIEIDLIRVGEPPPLRIRGNEHAPYRIVVSRAYERPRAAVYLFGIREPIPIFPIPLRRRETEPLLDLNKVLHELYARAHYELRVDYQREPHPPLTDEDANWADVLLREHGRRV